ncbi:hypothetical protein KBD81_06385 [Candidatus Woesebacteria bacterium]|nr:hypothetical protein [Candidatus Woesebacteria bacterium]
MKNLEQKPHVLHDLDGKKIVAVATVPFIAIVVVTALLLGGGTGFGLSKLMPNSGAIADSKGADATQVDASGNKTSAGILDKETFNDQAKGVLREGGFEGEGSFHLERPGGTDQNVYMTSSTVDLSEFIGKKVTVWGKTFDSKKAGWLMDVGYIEISK